MKIADPVASMSGAERGVGQAWCEALLAENAASPAADDGVMKKRAAKRLLSERETAVLRRLSLGESNKEAARQLRISPSTVRTHVESIFRKLGCSSRTAATLKGMNLGLI